MHASNMLLTLCFFLTESVVSLVNSIYRVRESVGKIQVCARVRQPKGSCPIRTSFSVLISTGDDTAGSVHVPVATCMYL